LASVLSFLAVVPKLPAIFGEFDPRVHCRTQTPTRTHLIVPRNQGYQRRGTRADAAESNMMSEPGTGLSRTQVSQVIKAPRERVYRACIDPEAVATWRVPDNMTARVHAFDAREGGGFRMSLTYQDAANSPGKSSEDTDTFEGRFVELVPGVRIVELIRFESQDASFAGDMKITTSLTDVGDATGITILCENIPPGIRPKDNETGTRQALLRLAALLA
jgi:uncharacterized protein YndB with AHSA1/START domain